MRAVILGIFLTFTAAAQAWGPTGHRTTGAIADLYLSDEARAAIADLIGGETLAESAIWADFMRSSDEEFWRKASPWHYVTVPDGTEYTPGQAPEKGDAFEALNMLRGTLLDENANREEKARALRFIVHIIGDLHQPLHVGKGDDRGGNDVKLTWHGQETNLHRVWDSHMIDGEKLSFSEWRDFLAHRITPELKDAWTEPDPLVWIAESKSLRGALYPSEPEIGYQYGFQHMQTLKTRLSQAGVRIAAYLNAVFAAS